MLGGGGKDSNVDWSKPQQHSSLRMSQIAFRNDLPDALNEFRFRQCKFRIRQIKVSEDVAASRLEMDGFVIDRLRDWPLVA